MNAQLTPEQRAQRTDEPRIERLRRTHIMDRHSLIAIVRDLNLTERTNTGVRAVRTNTGGHDLRTNEDIRNDILRAHGERVAAIKIERVLRGFVARRRAAWRRARLLSRLESLPAVLSMGLIGIGARAHEETKETEESRPGSLPVELAMSRILRMHRTRSQVLDVADLYCSHTLECVSPAIKRELYKDNNKVWSERLVARWPTEGPLLLGLRPGVRPGQLYHMFARKRNLRTNLNYHYGESPKPLDNSPDRLAFVLSLECGSFLLRWDGTQAVCEAVLETNVDVYSELATLHVIDRETLKCVTICKNLAAGGELDGDEGEDAYFMVPDIMRHNLPGKYEDSSDLHDLEVVEGDATAEVCRMQLWLTLQAQSNNTFILKAQFLENNCSLDIPDWVTMVDQDDSDDGLAVRQVITDAIEQSEQDGRNRRELAAQSLSHAC